MTYHRLPATIVSYLFLFFFIAAPISAQIPWNDLNPAPNFSTDGSFISKLLGGESGVQPGILAIAIVLGGLILLLMLIAGGFTLLTNPTSPEGQEKGKKRITWAIVGFLLLFMSYWIIQIIQIIFGVSIVS